MMNMLPLLPGYLGLSFTIYFSFVISFFASLLCPSIVFMKDEGKITDWTWEENKLFENVLLIYPEDCTDRWERIAAVLPGKTVADIKKHYEKLLVDIGNIESGEIASPDYPPPIEDPNVPDYPPLVEEDPNVPATEARNRKKSKNTGSRRNSKSWTEEEHRRFLMGLKFYGQGDWRSIARYCVLTRSATQVASHAQKYFTRRNASNKDRRRSSIHDITTLDGPYYNGPNSSGNHNTSCSNIWTPQDPESFGQTSLYGNSGLQSSQPPAGPPPVGAHGTGIEHHIVVSPPNLGLPQYMAYGMQVAAPEIAEPGSVLDAAIPGSPRNYSSIFPINFS